MYRIYLDGAANTPLDKKVFEKMKKVMPGYFGNSFATHEFGIRSMKIVEEARNKIANNLCVDSDQVYFTSGATESNNWVLKSLFLDELRKEKQYNNYCAKKRIIVSAIEHSSILHCCADLEKLGADIVYIYPDKKGHITPTILKKAITQDTLITAVMAVNNEIGTANPVNTLAKIAHKYESYFLADCTQMISYGGKYVELGKIFPDVDYMSFSGHKIYGPTGIGCLIVGENSPVYSFISGGAQELGKRGGTSNIAGIVGISEAIETIHKRDDYIRYEKLYEYFVEKTKDLNIVKINFVPDHKNIISIRLLVPNRRKKNLPSEITIANELDMEGVACSASSACDSSGETEEAPLSHVLINLGMKADDIKDTVRISMTRFTSKKDINILIDKIENIVNNWKGE